MSITTNCPVCGAALSLNENETSITCPYCSTHFNVNLDQAAPSLQKRETPEKPASETIVPSAEDVISPPQAEDNSASGSHFYHPPIAGDAGTTQADLYNPPISGQSSTNPDDVFNPPISSSGLPSSSSPFSRAAGGVTSRISGRGLWLTIAITAFVVFCISCLCLLSIVRITGN